MTPEIKAKELIEKYYEVYPIKRFDSKGVYECRYKAMQSALILCDEILDLGYSNESDSKVYSFYSDTKIQILKLLKSKNIKYEVEKITVD